MGVNNNTTNMAMSGVKLTEKCMTVYNEIQKAKKHRYAIFYIKDGEIDVEKLGELGNSYEQFLKDLQQKDGAKDDCRFAVYDYEYKYHPDGQKLSSNQRFSCCAGVQTAQLSRRRCCTLPAL